MGINLTKGGSIDLTKEAPGLSRVIVGLGWDPNRYDGGYDFDLDASCFMLDGNGKCTQDADFIFYKNLDSLDTSVHHTGDDRTGGNSDEGDDEQILVDLSKVDPRYQKISFTATIYQADQRQQNFGQVSNAYVRLVDAATDREILRYDLGEDFSIETAIVVCEIYRYNGDWKFKTVGAGYQGGLAALCRSFGLDVTGQG